MEKGGSNGVSCVGSVLDVQMELEGIGRIFVQTDCEDSLWSGW